MRLYDLYIKQIEAFRGTAEEMDSIFAFAELERNEGLTVEECMALCIYAQKLKQYRPSQRENEARKEAAVERAFKRLRGERE